MCAFQAGASCPAVSSKRHPGPQGLWSCRSRSLLLARCLELTASALERTGGPSQQGLSAPPGPDAHRAPLGGASRRHRPDGPGAPGRDLPAPSRAPAGRRRTAAGCGGANFYTYFLFRFGSGVALAPPRTRRLRRGFPSAWRRCLPLPEVAAKLFA